MRHHKYDGIFPSEWGLKITVSGWPQGALAAWQKMASFYGAVIIYHSLKCWGDLLKNGPIAKLSTGDMRE